MNEAIKPAGAIKKLLRLKNLSQIFIWKA
jgi:hypothetical protein